MPSMQIIYKFSATRYRPTWRHTQDAIQMPLGRCRRNDGRIVPEEDGQGIGPLFRSVPGGARRRRTQQLGAGGAHP